MGDWWNRGSDRRSSGNRRVLLDPGMVWHCCRPIQLNETFPDGGHTKQFSVYAQGATVQEMKDSAREHIQEWFEKAGSVMGTMPNVEFVHNGAFLVDEQ